MRTIFFVCLATLSLAVCSPGGEAMPHQLTPIPIQQVRIEDDF
jgi:hypothetical protein